MAKPESIFAVYLREEFLGIQNAPSAQAACIRYAHRGGMASGNVLMSMNAHPASPEERALACRYCRCRKERAAAELCDRCAKRAESPDDSRAARRALVARRMRTRPPVKP